MQTRRRILNRFDDVLFVIVLIAFASGCYFYYRAWQDYFDYRMQRYGTNQKLWEDVHSEHVRVFNQNVLEVQSRVLVSEQGQ